MFVNCVEAFYTDVGWSSLQAEDQRHFCVFDPKSKDRNMGHRPWAGHAFKAYPLWISLDR